MQHNHAHVAKPNPRMTFQCQDWWPNRTQILDWLFCHFEIKAYHTWLSFVFWSPSASFRQFCLESAPFLVSVLVITFSTRNPRISVLSFLYFQRASTQVLLSWSSTWSSATGFWTFPPYLDRLSAKFLHHHKIASCFWLLDSFFHNKLINSCGNFSLDRVWRSSLTFLFWFRFWFFGWT